MITLETTLMDTTDEKPTRPLPETQIIPTTAITRAGAEAAHDQN